jgi:hypothetical protein
MQKFTLYNKASILIFSAVLTGFGGALMLGHNLRVVGKNKKVASLVITILIANFILRQLVKSILLGSLYELFIPNIIIGLILIFPVWDMFLSEITTYNSKRIWIPLAVFVVLYGGLYLGNLMLQ